MLATRLRDADRKRLQFATLDTLGRVAERLLELTSASGSPPTDGVAVEMPFSPGAAGQLVRRLARGDGQGARRRCARSLHQHRAPEPDHPRHAGAERSRPAAVLTPSGRPARTRPVRGVRTSGQEGDDRPAPGFDHGLPDPRRSQRGVDGHPVAVRDGSQPTMRDGWHVEPVRQLHHAAPLGPHRQRQLESHDPRVLGPQPRAMKLHGAPQDHGSGHQIPRDRRGRARARVVVRVDPTAALMIGDTLGVVVTAVTPRGQLLRPASGCR